MNTKLVKRILATTLAATLMVAPVITAGATTDSSAASSSSSTTEEAPAPEELKDATAPVVAGGVVLKSDVGGKVLLPKTAAISGVVLRQSSATIKAAAGLAANEAPFLKAYEINAKKSPAAYAAFNGAAAAAGATVLDAVNIDLGKMTAGKFSDLAAGVSVPTTIAVKNANGRKLAVVKVLPGGATSILDDTDDNPNTVTFPVSGGLAAYAVIAY